MGKGISIVSGKVINIIAGDSITLATGSASITMTKDGKIKIIGTKVEIVGTGGVDIDGSLIDLN